jgi:4-diphosphocytidyl-2-C-methyl-D-erythritol kinase
MKEIARAKVNLCLEVTEKLPDGYHGVRSLMQSLEFGDTVELEPGDRPWRVRSDLPYLPSDEGNLAAKAALLFRRLTGLGPEGGPSASPSASPSAGASGAAAATPPPCCGS